MNHPYVFQDWTPGEDQDEAEQVERQRCNPQERHCRYIGADMRRHSEKQAGRDEREQQPAQPQWPIHLTD
jgi:hypothetical protein